ncbi:uncharacterized protein LOC118405910 isoform X1 [Branchiostoma floridae]|uniref:Uncharacterized protein LOC118405910 isoform X1 n=1 Tax=Branchiostoma floridae TaxID=7739 RepID=A0A9J7KGB0_BRAFL|nr:uncharacterized protein LOC118405910 isoform X1 [Branchiostoma floridae]
MDDQVSAACGFTTTFLAAGRVLCPRSTQCCSLDSGLPVGGRQLQRFGCAASNGGARDPEAPADLGQTLSTHRKDGRVLVFYLVGSNFRTVDIRQVWVENAHTGRQHRLQFDGGRQFLRFSCAASNGGAMEPEAPADLGQTIST